MGRASSYSVDAAWGKHLTDKLQATGIHYTISLGGASCDDMSKNCSKDQLVAAYEKVINTYHPQGLDFDIENGSANVLELN